MGGPVSDAGAGEEVAAGGAAEDAAVMVEAAERPVVASFSSAQSDSTIVSYHVAAMYSKESLSFS
jgi:hypothetical protein